MTTICDGLSVLELGAGSMPASMIGMILADNGARVTKLEPPEGDRLRTLAPSAFLVWNRGKNSRVVDLRMPEGQAEARALAGRVDVVIEGFGAGVADAWGLGPDELLAENPGLVYCSLKGFGREGPYAHLKAYDGIVMAKAGLFSRGDWGFREGPIFAGVAFASSSTAQLGLSGILAALIAREQSGRGQLVDAAMVQGASAADVFGTMQWQYAVRTGNEPHVVIAPIGVMAATRYHMQLCTQDGRFVAVAPMLPHQAQALSRALGLGHLVANPRYASMGRFPTREDAQAWQDLLFDAFRGKSLADWVPILEADTDIPFEICRTSEEGLDHPQIVHNGGSITVVDPNHGPIRQVGPVARFARTPSTIDRSAPRLGASDVAPNGPSPVPGSGDAPTHPLQGVTIVELGYFFAMPFALTHAAALGARVIKIEGHEGDPMRSSFGIPETGGVRTMEGKESVSLDIRTEGGRTILHDLVSRADVFVTSFRQDTLERRGLDHATLSRLNSRLVYIHAAGYGTDGPYSTRPMYGPTAGSAAGEAYRHSGYWLDTELTKGWSTSEIDAVIIPRLRTLVEGDPNAAMVLLSALLLALYDQRRTGEGQFVSTSMLTGSAYAYSDDFNAYAGKPPYPLADPEQHGFNALYRLYRSSQGWVFLAVPTQGEWRAFVKAAGLDHIGDDERYATPAARMDNDDALVAVLEELFGTKPAAEWERLLAANGVGCVQVFEGGNSGFTCTDPVLRDTGLVVEVEHPTFGTILRHGLPVRFSETPGRIAPSCLRGEHNQLVLRELGYTPEQIAALERDAAVFPPD